MRYFFAALAIALPLIVVAQEDEETERPDPPTTVEGDRGHSLSGQGIGTDVAPMKPLRGNRGGQSASSGGGAAGGAGGGDGGSGVFGKGSCPGHSKTFWVEIDPKAVGLVFDTVRHGGIGTDGAVVVKLRTSTKPAPDAVQNVGIVEYPGTADYATKHVAISPKPCDFMGAATTDQLKSSGIEVSLTWAYGVSPAVKKKQMGYLAPNTVYYLNVTNEGCKPSSKDRTCDMRVETGAPNALREALGWGPPEEPLHFQR